MNTNQVRLQVYMYNATVKRRNLEGQAIPTLIRPVLRWIWPKVVMYMESRGIPVPVKGLISTGTHTTKGGESQVKISLFDSNDVRIGQLTVYNEIDDFKLELFEGERWDNGNIDDLEVGFTIALE